MKLILTSLVHFQAATIFQLPEIKVHKVDDEKENLSNNLDKSKDEDAKSISETRAKYPDTEPLSNCENSNKVDFNQKLEDADKISLAKESITNPESESMIKTKPKDHVDQSFEAPGNKSERLSFEWSIIQNCCRKNK